MAYPEILLQLTLARSKIEYIPNNVISIIL